MSAAAHVGRSGAFRDQVVTEESVPPPLLVQAVFDLLWKFTHFM